MMVSSSRPEGLADHRFLHSWFHLRVEDKVVYLEPIIVYFQTLLDFFEVLKNIFLFLESEAMSGERFPWL